MKKLIFIFYLLIFIFPAAFAATEIRDTEIESVLYEMVAPIGRAAGIPDGRLRIHLIGDNQFNAFVMGGEDIYIYTGLIQKIKNPNAVQAVVAHELGHMTGGHMVQMSDRMAAEMKRMLVMQALGAGLIALNPQAGVGLLAGAGGMAQQSLLAFSRDEERQADAAGLDLLARAGVPTAGFLEVMRLMQDMQSEDKINPNNTNHPLTAERLQNIKEKLKSMKQDKTAAPDEKSYALVRAKLDGYLGTRDAVAATYPAADKSDAAIYARAIFNMTRGNLALAKTGAQTLIRRGPGNPFFYELMGDLEYKYGHYDDSIAAYGAALKLRPNAPQIQTAQALVLTERRRPGDADSAAGLAKLAIISDPGPLAYFVLSRAEKLRGNEGESDWAMAEYYNLIKKPGETKKYAKSAMGKLQKNSPEYLKANDLLKIIKDK
ncbi:MAG: M48 family metalloprotease [Rickettsiales bacterium]|jgi:predicted Zn-dependent protease|nr:M48 family metalloprotease [Rickettsiales bacterium]